MKIWIVSDGEPLPSDKNARLRRMGMLAEKLANRNHEVRWFSSNFHHYNKEFRSDKNVILEIKENYLIHLISTKGYKKNVSFARIKHYKDLSTKFKSMASTLEKPDVILATMAPIELSKAVKEFAQSNNIAYVVDIRDLWPDVYYDVIPEKLHRILDFYVNNSRKKLSKVLSNSDSIIGVTPHFLNYGLTISKMEAREYDQTFYTSYANNDYSFYGKNFEKYWANYNLNSQDFIVTFIGNFGKQFNFDPLIESIKNFKNHNIKFVLCGTGENLDYFKELQNHQNNIILPGWVGENEIFSLLSVSKIGIAPYKNIPNFQLNTPNKFGEYLSASLPILTGVDGIMKELLEEYNCGYNYKNSDELTLYIKELYENEDVLEQMSEAAHKLFDKNFNADKVYEDLASHLEKIGRT